MDRVLCGAARGDHGGARTRCRRIPRGRRCGGRMSRAVPAAARRPGNGRGRVGPRGQAGAWSHHRFARRREKQAATALGAAADTAVAVFGPHLRRLDAVVLGGDRRTVAGLRDDPRLGPYFDLAVERFLTVPDPRLAVLRETPRMFRSVRIWIADGEGAGD